MLGQPRIKTLDWLILSKLDRIGSNVGANPTNRVVELLVQLLSPGQHLLKELDQGVVVGPFHGRTFKPESGLQSPAGR